MNGVDMDLYALVANKLLAERIAAQNAARIAASSISVPRAPSAVDVQQKRASAETFLEPGDLSKSSGLAEMASKAKDLIARGGNWLGRTMAKSENAAKSTRAWVNRGIGKVRGAFEHGNRAMDAAYAGVKNPVRGVPGSPEFTAGVARNQEYVRAQRLARKAKLKAAIKSPVAPTGRGAPLAQGSLLDRAKELMGAGAMLGYQLSGDGEEKTGKPRNRAGKAATGPGAQKARRAAQAPPPGGPTAPPPGGPTPPPVPPSGTIGGAAAGGAGVNPAPGDLASHLKNLYNMKGSDWQRRGLKRLGHLGSYLAEHHPLASAGMAGLGGLAAMYGARKLYRDFLGGGDQERPKITIGM